MIQYLPHRKIDKIRWDRTIEKAQKNLIYGYSWYLDIVSPSWDALIYGDYEAIMPLTWKKKFGINYLIQPILTQQLGIFSDVSSEITFDKFLDSLPTKFKKIYIKLNESNFTIKYDHLLRENTNFTLDLSLNYNSIYSNYSKSLKNNLKRAIASNITITTDFQQEVILNFLQEHLLNRISLNTASVKQIIQLVLNECWKRNLLRVFTANINNEQVSVVVLLNSFDRWILLLSASNKMGKLNNCKSYILDNFIKERAGKSEILDFEGSNLPNIAKYNASFGAIKTQYFTLKSLNPNLFNIRKISLSIQNSIFK